MSWFWIGGDGFAYLLRALESAGFTGLAAVVCQAMGWEL